MTLINDVFKSTHAYQIKPLQPFGIALIANQLQRVDQVMLGCLLKELVKTYRLVLLRGFSSIDKDDLVHYAESVGPLLEWEFGKVMEMRVQAEPKNYLFTHGPVPFHWDGAFYQVPRYLLFHCIEAPLEKTGGETLFTDTTRIWLNASFSEKQQWMEKRISYQTEKLAHYGGKITEALVQTHPDTGDIILRFAENVPSTMLNPVDVWVEGEQELDTQTILSVIATRCYQTDYCYQHTWQTHDFLLADNHALIHGRNAFANFSPRHLRRIQIM
jgi:alpha-ketoglutarate-dependent taurine dioxygenase